MAMETAGDGKPLQFLHEPPVLSVTQPNGSFCQVDARFSVPLPPDDVYDIITRPNSESVFKNIEEIAYRRVLQDDGNRQLVEVEQIGRWRFLMISETFSCRVLLEQDRQQHRMTYDLIKQGMMKKFSGSWKIDEIGPSEARSSNDVVAPKKSRRSEKQAKLGSWITFSQVLEPAILPPWPLNGYVRGVTDKTMREMLGDLQRECIRLAEIKEGGGFQTIC